MATAEKIGEVTRTEFVVVKPAKVVLELTHEEADALTAILCRVGGSSSDSPRKHAAAISNALYKVGYEYETCEAYKYLEPYKTGIIFQERVVNPRVSF